MSAMGLDSASSTPGRTPNRDSTKAPRGSSRTRWTEQRTPRRSAASAKSGQRASSSVSGQLTATPVSAASTSGPRPILNCRSASSAKSGWVAAALTTSPSRQTAACAPERAGTCQAASSASLFSDLASPPLVRLSSSAASCPSCSIGTRSSIPGSLFTLWRYQPGPVLNGSAAAEQTVEGAPDLFGQLGVACAAPGATGSSGGPPDTGGPRVGIPVLRAGQRRDQDRGGLADQAAVQALDLAQPTDQVHAAALGAGFKVSGPVARFLAGRADQHELVMPDTAPPRALTPLRIGLPHTASVTGHVSTPTRRPRKPERLQGTP